MVSGKQKDIQEVKNAYKAYEEIDNILLNPIYYRYGNHINNEKAIEVFHIALK